MRAAQQRNPQAANQLSVAMELQADCFAGVWGHSTDQRRLLDPGEVKGGLDAAAAVGDDRLQRMSTGRVNPETFTHGSSQQRMDWFQKGFSSGHIKECNTFAQLRKGRPATLVMCRMWKTKGTPPLRVRRFRE